MLKIVFGDIENSIYHPPTYFDNQYEDEWITNPLSVEMIRDIDKSEVGIPDDKKLKPGQHETMCNPILQAKLLNEQKTEFNITVGLCVGHDSLFIRYSEAMVTALIVKDRVLAHNPAGAIYCAEGYFKNRL